MIVFILNTQYRSEVPIQLHSCPAFDQFMAAKVLVPALWTQWSVKQPLGAVWVRQSLGVFSRFLYDVTYNAKATAIGWNCASYSETRFTRHTRDEYASIAERRIPAYTGATCAVVTAHSWLGVSIGYTCDGGAKAGVASEYTH
jgi:hypothetical protein